jgi:hypothetical protein
MRRLCSVLGRLVITAAVRKQAEMCDEQGLPRWQ